MSDILFWIWDSFSKCTCRNIYILFIWTFFLCVVNEFNINCQSYHSFFPRKRSIVVKCPDSSKIMSVRLVSRILAFRNFFLTTLSQNVLNKNWSNFVDARRAQFMDRTKYSHVLNWWYICFNQNYCTNPFFVFLEEKVYNLKFKKKYISIHYQTKI